MYWLCSKSQSKRPWRQNKQLITPFLIVENTSNVFMFHFHTTWHPLPLQNQINLNNHWYEACYITLCFPVCHLAKNTPRYHHWTSDINTRWGWKAKKQQFLSLVSFWNCHLVLNHKQQTGKRASVGFWTWAKSQLQQWLAGAATRPITEGAAARPRERLRAQFAIYVTLRWKTDG